MDAINSATASPCFLPDKDDHLRTLQASRTDLAVVSRTQQMEIELVTAEGDKVTLSVDSRAAGLQASYEDVQTDDSGTATYRKSELTMGLYQRDMSFTVEGDLSAAELRDINKTLKTLDKMMNRFVNGKLGSLAAQTRKLQGLNTIADLEVHITTESRTLTATQFQAAATYDRLGMPSITSADTPESANPISPAEADGMADAMAEEIRSASTPTHRMMQFVNQLLDDYRRQMEDLDRFGRQIMGRIDGRLSRMLSQDAMHA
jgi:hypothetical protein